MATVTTADKLLLQLDSADQAHRPREPFLVVPGMSPLPGVPVQHPGLGPAFRCEEEDLAALADAGCLRIQQSGSGWTSDVTAEGTTHAQKLRLADTSPSIANEPVARQDPLAWEARALPVLRAVARAYATQPSEIGVSSQAVTDELGPEADADEVGLVLDELERARYVEETLGGDHVPGPAWCRLTEKGLQVTAGWPTSSGEIALERLLAIVDERIAAAASDEERSKWERLRDGIADVGVGVVTGVLTNVANAAAKGLIT